MSLTTKLDFSNRQINQKEKTIINLNGGINLGVQYSGLTGGPDYFTSATTAVYENVISSFSGNLTTTNFSFGLPQMNGSETYLNTITTTNSNTLQIVEPYLVGNDPQINPIIGNTVYQNYSGTSFEFKITNFNEYSPNLFTGTAISEIVYTYSANTNDYSGDGVWLKVNGKLETEDLIINKYTKIGQLFTGASTTDIAINAQGYIVDVLSDEKLKENIITIDSALDKVLALRGVYYNWIDRQNGGDATRIGFIAQEVKEIVPELVFPSQDGKYLGVKYDNVTALLVEAIKELSNKNTQTQIPKTSKDTIGLIGDVISDNNFLYVKTEVDWKRIKLETF
jgi:hypothetical protein